MYVYEKKHYELSKADIMTIAEYFKKEFGITDITRIDITPHRCEIETLGRISMEPSPNENDEVMMAQIALFNERVHSLNKQD